MAYRVLLVDDHPVLTDGLKIMIDNDADFQVVGVFSDANYALSFLKADSKVDLIILDHSMPELSGIAFMNQAKSMCNPPKILMLTMHDEPAMIKEAIGAGVDGYVLKKSASEELLIGMRAVMSGKPYWSAEVGHKTFQYAQHSSSHDSQLTGRECEVLSLILKELTNKEIAQQLSISERTVEVHRKNIMRKAGASNTVGLIKYAYSLGLVN